MTHTPYRRRMGLVAILVTLLALVAACGSSTPPTKKQSGASTTAAAGAHATTIDVKNFMFMPMSVTVKAGTTVTWKFEDSAQHTVTAKDKSFSSPKLANGKTYSHKFTKPGTYAYYCSIHQYMTATIVVK